MRPPLLIATACLSLTATGSLAQDSEYAEETGYEAPLNADYIAATGQQRTAAPLIGLRRRADFLVMTVSFASDSRDYSTRRQEIHTMLLGALNKAGPAGVELATGSPVLAPLTRDNYTTVNLVWAGREDTSQAMVMVKVPLTGEPAEAEKRINAFLRGLERKGRGTITNSGGRQLALRNPGQYRGAIVKLIADDVRSNAGTFGPDYRATIDGIDKPVQWSQVSDTDVFLYLPYTYRIVAQ